MLQILTYFAFLTLSIAQIFRPFGLYEYYWSIEPNDYVRSDVAAEQRCNQMDATLAIVNRKEIGEFLREQIEKATSKLLIIVGCK